MVCACVRSWLAFGWVSRNKSVGLKSGYPEANLLPSCIQYSGVQKTQEAIENTIGNNTKNQPQKKPTKVEKPKTAKRNQLSREELEKRASRRLLGDLYIDKEYLENLIKHPDLRKADTNTEGVSEYAKDAINFLNNRQEFWRQQKPCTSLNAKKINGANGMLPRWL